MNHTRSFQLEFRFGNLLVRCSSRRDRSVTCVSKNLYQLERIYARALDRKAPMEVRSGDAACGAYFPEHLAGLQFVAGFHIDFGEVAIESVNAQTMINDNGVAGEKQLLGKSHSPILRGMNGSARYCGEIHAAVRRTGLAIQNAALAEIAAGRHVIQRNPKIAIP